MLGVNILHWTEPSDIEIQTEDFENSQVFIVFACDAANMSPVNMCLYTKHANLWFPHKRNEMLRTC